MFDQDETFNSACRTLFLAFPVLALGLFVFTVKQTEASGCPIVVDLNGNGKIDITGHTSTEEKLYTLFSAGNYVSFDIFGDGEPEQIDWVQPNTDGILVDISEWSPGSPFTGLNLFGTVGLSQDDNILNFENGFKKLQAYDLDGDGIISDGETSGLRLWIDDGDAFPSPSELFSFEDKEIASISTSFTYSPGPYGAEVLASFATSTAGQRVYVEDIWFMTPNDVSANHAPFVAAFDWLGF